MNTSRILKTGLLEAEGQDLAWEELKLCQEFHVDAQPRFAVACPAMRPHDPIYDSVGDLVQSNVRPHMTGTQVDSVSTGVVVGGSVLLSSLVIAFEEAHTWYWDTIQTRRLRNQLHHVQL